MKKQLLLVAATLAFSVCAMPTRDEQKQAASVVAELMNPLVADFKAKKKTSVEVGETAMAYAKEANTEAAKFLLLKGAIWYFAQAKEDAKAVAATIALGEMVTNLPPEVMRNDVLKPAIDHVSEQNAPGLFAQYRVASARVEIAKLKPSLRRADEITRRRYAELLAVTGDWKAALTVFADIKAGKIVKDELAGKALAAAGDFWWDYKPVEEMVAESIKAHAVALYREAIASGELTGLKKAVAEKRIASVSSSDSFNVSARGSGTLAASGTPRGSGTPAASGTPRECGTLAASKALYCVIDLSAGPDAGKYPVSYLAAEPKGGFNTDEYKTTKLVLRRIDPGTFIMGENQKDESHRVKITKPFYMGIFELTQKQYALVTGNAPAKYSGDMRPVEWVSYNNIRGSSNGAQWPASSAVDVDSFMGKFRERTGLEFDLPTKAQWEYACRAGTTSTYNNGGDSEDDMKVLGRYKGNQFDGKGGYSQHTTVGSYLPNAWGLYDMHGNVSERCLDWDGALTFGTDPKGVSVGSERVHCGGAWRYGTGKGACCSFWRPAA